MKIIIVGAGEVGFNIAQRLSEENHDVVVIDKDQNKINHIQTVIDVWKLSFQNTMTSQLRRFFMSLKNSPDYFSVL